MNWPDLADELPQAAREQTTGATPDWTLTTPAESLRRAASRTRPVVDVTGD